MNRNFPHLKGSGPAYGSGREVFEQIPGEFNYTRWEDAQAHVKLMCVPWCGDYDNVFGFDDESARDKWIDSQDGYEFDTAWRMPPTDTYRVDAPYTTAIYYNYLVIDLPTETSDSERLPGVDTSKRVGRLCYFVTDARAVGEGVSELNVTLDVWTTFIARLSIDYMMLARGHAPMAETSVDAYLSAPATHCEHLLSGDVNAGPATLSRSHKEHIINSETIGVIWSTADPAGAWDSQYGSVPTSPVSYQGAALSSAAWIVDDITAFFNAVWAQRPAFLQTVLAVGSVPSELVSKGAATELAGITMWRAVAQNRGVNLGTFSPDDFGYPAAYRNITKLYTSPYAHLEITDETGSVITVAVEDTTGALALNETISLAWPYIKCESHVRGIGKAAQTDYTWDNIGASGFMAFEGQWYETLRAHDVPIFAIRESSANNYDHAAYYVRAQAQTAASNARASALASNATAYTNAQNSAANVTANNAVNVAMASAATSLKNTSNTTGAGYSINKIKTDVQYDIGNSNAAFDAQRDSLAVAATNNDARAQTAAATTAVSGIAETAGSLLSGDIGGAVGAIASTAMSGLQTATDWQTTNASITVSQSNNESVYNQAVTSAYGKQDASIAFTNSSTALGNSTATQLTTNANNAQTSVANNNASLVTTNAANSKTTGDANAERAYNTATSAIQNGINQAALGAPMEFGTQNPGTAATRPMLRQVNVVTQTDGAIAVAGDAMLRYGYMAGYAWHVTTWCPCQKFCYWQAEDLWIAGCGNVAEKYQNIIKNIFINGVTIWKRPEDIGKVSVYDNGF